MHNQGRFKPENIYIAGTNYMDEDRFQKFLFWLVRLEPFINLEHRYPMDANHFVGLFKILYDCGLRISEALKLTKKDFDLQHRILRIHDAKTGKGKVQKTTILPHDIPWLQKLLTDKKDDEIIFPTTRMTVWKYGRNAGRLAGLDIFESQHERDISNVWTHLFRKSCAKRMRKMGAGLELCQIKLRHSFQYSIDHYVNPDINALLEWEAEHFPLQQSDNVT